MPTANRPRIVHRPIQFDFRSVPRHWFGGNALGTHVSNAIHLLFPAGERFFIRSVRHFAEEVKDPVLREQIRAFHAQEGSHSRAHEAQFEALEQQGYVLRPFLAAYERLMFEWIEPHAPPELRLAVTAALEHYTAIMAENAFTEGVLDDAHPVMKDLLFWHAAEELEHKAVAFDVLATVNPSYELRIAGMAIATLGLFGMWGTALVTLLRQEKRLTRAKLVLPKRLEERSILTSVVIRGLRDYLRRDFHPNDRDNRRPSEAYLESVGLLEGVTTSAIA